MNELERLLQEALANAEKRLWGAAKAHGIERDEKTLKELLASRAEFLAGMAEGQFSESSKKGMILNSISVTYDLMDAIKTEGIGDVSQILAVFEFLFTAGIIVGMTNPLPDDLYDSFSRTIISSTSKERGRAGGKSRHAKMTQLKEFARARYRAGGWKSMRDAANKLLPDVLKESERIGANISTDNAFRTVYDWIRLDFVKSPSV